MFYAVSKAMFYVALKDWNFFNGHPFGEFYFYISWFFWFFVAICGFISWWVWLEAFTKNDYNIHLQNRLYLHQLKKMELLKCND